MSISMLGLNAEGSMVFMRKECKVEIAELSRSGAYLRELRSRYTMSHYYDVSVRRKCESWTISLTCKPFEKTLEKEYRGKLFEDHVSEPRVFVAAMDQKEVGWIELGYDKWNNRMRVWEFLVEQEFRKQGIGTALMTHAVKTAREKGARMLVLETQTNNSAGISFYLSFGFEFLGLDLMAYSNEDVEKKEVRLELGLKL